MQRLSFADDSIVITYFQARHHLFYMSQEHERERLPGQVGPVVRKLFCHDQLISSLLCVPRWVPVMTSEEIVGLLRQSMQETRERAQRQAWLQRMRSDKPYVAKLLDLRTWLQNTFGGRQPSSEMPLDEVLPPAGMLLAHRGLIDLQAMKDIEAASNLTITIMPWGCPVYSYYVMKPKRSDRQTTELPNVSSIDNNFHGVHQGVVFPCR